MSERRKLIGDLKLPSNFPTEIDESLALGLDLGVGSCGQALVTDQGAPKYSIHEVPDFPGRINFLGVRAFDVPEIHEQTGIKLKNPERRAKRLLRRTTDRRANRMWALRRLLKKHQVLPEDYPTSEKLWKHSPARGENPTFDKWRDWHSRMTAGENGEDLGQAGPWVWRVKALDEKLEPLELAAVLLHLNKHRGFRSNRKSEAADDEGGKVLQAVRENTARLESKGYRTIGEMFLKDPEFADRKRNTSGVYTGVILRKQQEDEAKKIFKAQRELGNSCATEEIEEAFLEIYNRQLPLQNPIKLLGDCPFEPGHKRSSRLAPSFELSRALQKLNNLTLVIPSQGKVRLAEHVDAANGGYQPFIDAFSTFKGTKTNPGRITWKDLRKIFNLVPETKFLDLPTPTKSKKKDGSETIQSETSLEGEDFLSRSSANNAARGSFLLRQAIGDDLWLRLWKDSPEQLDSAAHALSFFEEIENEHTKPENWGIINQMEHDQLDPDLVAAVKGDLRSDAPTLHKFKDTANMSALASRKLLPFLEGGVIYPEACTEVYGDHRQNSFSFEDITNPVVKSVVLESLKQVIHLINETGKIPGRICVELSRDLGKSIKERNEIEAGISKRTRNKNANRDHLADALGRNPDADELLRYELWLEQGNLCPYSGESLSGNLRDVAQSPLFQVDHILPRSRSHDNSFDNKVLVHAKCNQHKGNATPFEFHEIGNGDENSPGWLAFTSRVRSMQGIRTHKRRHLLNTTFAEDESKFAARHLNDTSYISKLVTSCLQQIYVHAGEKPLTEKGSTRRVFTQPGQLTSLVRRAWGLENLKKDVQGERIGDKHHAVDALVCALLSEGQRQFVTRLEKEKREMKSNLAQSAFPTLTRSYQLMEKENRHQFTPRGVSAPWEGFRQDVAAALDLFTVSRREIRKGTGSLHLDTLYSVRTDDKGEETVYSRKPIISLINGKPKGNLSLTQIEKVRGIDDPRNQWLREALTTWIEAGCPVEHENLPRDPGGNVIRRVYLDQGKKSGRKYPQGYATGGDQVRLDIFSKTKPDGSKVYSLVPVYTYHLVDNTPPKLAIVANKSEDHWELMTPEHRFEFSLHKNTRVELRKKPSTKAPKGDHVVGVYQGCDRATGAISLSDPDDSTQQFRMSPKQGTLIFRKIETDRLGREYVVGKEKRTWRGKTVG
ncbi:MAG: type II CRISPR RNA-guided endonuclease Cas9 [Akkermansiaceae bacterium]